MLLGSYFHRKFYPMKTFSGEVDPLKAPDDPNNPPKLKRFNLVRKEGLDSFLEEEHGRALFRFRRYYPEWLRIRLNPPRRLTWSLIENASLDDRRDHMDRWLKELEIAMAEGHDRIIVQPQKLALYCLDYISVCEHCHYYALTWSVNTLWIYWCYPNTWWVWTPMALSSMLNAIAYSRYCRTDRLSRYEMWEPDLFDYGEFVPEYEDEAPIEEVENFDKEDENDDEDKEDDINAGEETERIPWPGPVWMLCRIGQVRSNFVYFYHQTCSCLAMILVARRLGHFQDGFGTSADMISIPSLPTNLEIANLSYFLPNFLFEDEVEVPLPMPQDIYSLYISPYFDGPLDQWIVFIGLIWYSWDLFQHVKPDNLSGYWPRPEETDHNMYSQEVGEDGWIEVMPDNGPLPNPDDDSELICERGKNSKRP